MPPIFHPYHSMNNESTTMITYTAPTTQDDTTETVTDAEIIFDVTSFVDIFTADGTIEARSTGHQMSLKNPHPKVSVDENDSTMIIVRPPGARLRFTLSPEEFFPIGIAFQLREGVAEPTDLERLGLLNFTQMKLRPQGNMLAITDIFKDREADDRYKFSIIVQHGRKGTIGIIDPGIRHRPN